MSNPLKRVLNPVGNMDDATFGASTGALPGIDPGQLYQDETWLPGLLPNSSRQSQYLGPNHANPNRYAKMIYD